MSPLWEPQSSCNLHLSTTYEVDNPRLRKWDISSALNQQITCTLYSWFCGYAQEFNARQIETCGHYFRSENAQETWLCLRNCVSRSLVQFRWQVNNAFGLRCPEHGRVQRLRTPLYAYIYVMGQSSRCFNGVVRKFSVSRRKLFLLWL